MDLWTGANKTYSDQVLRKLGLFTILILTRSNWVKVGISKLSADARIEQPHSQMACTFKPRPAAKPLFRDVGNTPATLSIGDFIANLAENSKRLKPKKGTTKL